MTDYKGSNIKTYQVRRVSVKLEIIRTYTYTMSDKKITDLPILATADATDILPIVDVSGNVTKRVTTSGIAAAVAANTPANAITPIMRSGGFKVGIIPGSTFGTTGNKSITGVGFKPRLVRFTALTPAEGTNANFNQGAMDETGSQYLQATAGQANDSFTRNSSTARCLGAIVGTGTSFILSASYVSMDSDGFTINVQNAVTAYNVAYEAYA
jgi:hypothetical protein